MQHVRVPAQVDQPELVVRQGAGELALVETRQWIAPLKDEIRGALSAALTQRLHAHDVAGVSAPAPVPVQRQTRTRRRRQPQGVRTICGRVQQRR